MEDFISSGDGVTVRRTNVLDGSASSLDDVLAPPFLKQRTALTQLRNERLQFGVVQVVGVGGPRAPSAPNRKKKSSTERRTCSSTTSERVYAPTRWSSSTKSQTEAGDAPTKP